MQKTTNGEVTSYRYNARNQLLEEQTGAEQILLLKDELTQETFRFVYGEELLSRSNGAMVWTYQTDRRGSVIGRLDASGTLAEEL